jgi:hypothetical protein
MSWKAVFGKAVFDPGATQSLQNIVYPMAAIVPHKAIIPSIPFSIGFVVIDPLSEFFCRLMVQTLHVHTFPL